MVTLLKIISQFKSSALIIIVLFIMLIINLSSCSNKPLKTYTLTDISDFNNKITGSTDPAHLPSMVGEPSGWLLRLFDWESNFIPGHSNINYTEQPLKYVVSYANCNTFADRFKLMVFIDGYIQPFKVDDQEIETDSYTRLMPPLSLINIPITFTPQRDSLNEKHFLSFVAVYSLDGIPGVTHPHIPNCVFSYRFTLIYTKNSGNNYNELIPEGNIIPGRPEAIYGFTMAIYKNDFDPGIYFNQPVRVNVQKGQTTAFRLEAVARNNFPNNPEGTYSTIVFLDHQPLTLFNGKENLIWHVSSDKQLYHQFDLPVPDQPGEYQVYSLTSALNSDEDKVFSSGKFILEVTE